MPAPIDHAVRIQAATAVEQSCTLAAGAGAGKTSVLVDRLVHHLLAGVPAENIAAITFTRAAANELMSRSRDAIEQRLERAVTADNTAEIDKLTGILSSFGQLTLSTIHAFCKALLESEALEAKWSPDTEVANALGAAALEPLYTDWRQGFDQRHPELVLLLRAQAAETSYHQSPSIRRLADTLLENRDLEPVMAERAALDWDSARHDLLALRDGLAQALDRCLNPGACKLIAAGKPYLDQLSSLCQGLVDPQACVLAALALKVSKVGRKGNKKDWAPADKAAAHQAFKDVMAWQALWSAQIGAQLHAALVADLLAHYLPAVQAARLKLAQADFADLLFRSRRLLLERPAARERLSERFQALLIDEVQDTDPIQAEVATLLARPHDQVGPWQQSTPAPGSLFVVGDPRQSIYRFRRADVQVWEQLRDVVAHNGTALTLRQNFRSVPGIVSWVNHVFAGLPGFVAQEAFRQPATLPPVVTLQVENSSEELDALIAHLLVLRSSGAEVFDKELGVLRPLRDSDILILLPSWTVSKTLQEKLLLAGIECTVDGGASFFDRDEIRLAMAAMRAIEEPGDGEAVVCVLRGIFGVSFTDLAQHRLAEGSWSFLHPSQPPGPVSDALKELRHLHSERHRQSWADLIDGLLDATAAPAVWALTARRWSILANLDKLRALIRQIEPKTRSSSEVIEALEQLRSGGTEDLSLIDDDINSARIMTYFKAKGLEAPVVALVSATRTAGTVNHTVRRQGGDDWLAATASTSVTPPDWTDYKAAEQAALAEERRRWMYVAATRARDHLILVTSLKGGKLYGPDIASGMGSLSPALHGVAQAIAPGVSVTHIDVNRLPDVVYDRSTFPGQDAQVDALLQDVSALGDPAGEKRQRARLSALAASRRGSTRWRSVGSLGRRKVITFEGGGVGPRGGTLVHKVMEHLDLAQPSHELERQVPGLVRAFGLQANIDGELLDRCQDVVMRLLGHPVIEQARQATERWREVDFAHKVRGTVVAGRIDLCFPTNAARTDWVVVDWKSHLPPAGSPLHDRYRTQLASYARALLKTVTPCTSVNPVLAGPHQEIGIGSQLADKLEVVHPYLVELLATLHQAGHEPEVGLELDGRPYVILELAWEEERIGLGLDLSPQEIAVTEQAGWTLVLADTTQPAWPSRSREALLALFEIPDDDESGAQEPPEGET